MVITFCPTFVLIMNQDTDVSRLPLVPRAGQWPVRRLRARVACEVWAAGGSRRGRGQSRLAQLRPRLRSRDPGWVCALPYVRPDALGLRGARRRVVLSNREVRM